MNDRSGLALLAAALLLPCLGACGSGPMTTIEEGAAYPATLTKGNVVDIQVFRVGTRMELVNTTSRAFGPSTLWLNKRFSREIDGLAVGERLEIDLGEFKDEFGQPFKRGGFFSAEAPDVIVLTELVTTTPEGSAELVGLVTILRPLD
jgi:hypothetical protein